MTSPLGPDRDDDGTWIDLRLLATTDLHMQIHPYDYFRDRATGNSGLTVLSTLIGQARAEAANTLLFDNGDFLQGSPLGDHALQGGGADGEERPHPMIAAMNLMGYDAVTLGNHEFNFGLPALERTIAAARFPIVLANVVRDTGAVPGDYTPEDDTPWLPPFVLLDRHMTDRLGRRHGLRIGVIGLVTPLVTVWDREHLEGRLTAHDPVATARALVPRMRAAGADLVVALHHAGIGSADWTPGMEDAAIPLARLASVDVQILGHNHRSFPGPDFAGREGVDTDAGRVGGVPAVMAGAFASHLGQIDLSLRLGPAGVEIRAATVVLREVTDDLAPDATGQRIARGIMPAHLRTLDRIRRPLGRTETPIDSYFALVAGDASLSLMAHAQGAFVRHALADGPWRDWPVLSAVAPFAAGGRGGPNNYTDIPAGPLLMRHPAEMIRFPNTVRALAVTGAELAEWLERSAAQFRHIPEGSRDRPLIDPAMPCYNFDVIHGLTYAIDLSVPARYDPAGQPLPQGRRRIRDLRHRGRTIGPEDRFILATNSYRTAGGGGFPALSRSEPVLCAADLGRDVLIGHIHAVGTVRPLREPVWRFTPLPDTTVLFDTGPGAARVLAGDHGPADRRIAALGMTPDGFLRCRLHLRP